MYIIDGHQDLAYNKFQSNIDYTLSVAQNRARILDDCEFLPSIGWPELQSGRVAVVCATVFLSPPDFRKGDLRSGASYDTREECHDAVLRQLNWYHFCAVKHPDKFSILKTQNNLRSHLTQWEQIDANVEDTHPVGLIILWEGAEGLRSFDDLDDYWQLGLRMIGPVWEGGRFCGGTIKPSANGFDSEGRALLSKMAQTGFILDTAHMDTLSMSQALDLYPQTICCTHGNCRTLLKNPLNERHLTDQNIQKIAQRGGVIGVLPYNGFLSTEWKKGLSRELITLNTLIDHIDHICQLCGSADYVALGSDMDGGFGYPDIPLEMENIKDLVKIETALAVRGYAPAEIEKILYGNWRRIFLKALP